MVFNNSYKSQITNYDGHLIIKEKAIFVIIVTL